MHYNLDHERKEHLKIENKKRKKAKSDNLNIDEKEQLRKREKKGKKAMRDNHDDEKNEHSKIEENKRKKAKHDNLNVAEKEQKKKMNKRLQTLDERNSIFNNIQMCSIVDPSILTTPTFRLIEEDFKSAIQEGPT